MEDRILLEDTADIRNLFRMTPYFWKTPREGSRRLETVRRLEVGISFRIHCFTRSEGDAP